MGHCCRCCPCQQLQNRRESKKTISIKWKKRRLKKVSVSALWCSYFAQIQRIANANEISQESTIHLKDNALFNTVDDAAEENEPKRTSRAGVNEPPPLTTIVGLQSGGGNPVHRPEDLAKCLFGQWKRGDLLMVKDCQEQGK